MKVVFRDLPYEIGGCTVKSIDSGEVYYTVIINARLSAERQRAAYEHEMNHIEANDFQRAKELGTSMVERDVRKKAGIRQ